MMKKDNDYYVNFRGAKLNRLQANRAGVGIFFGIIGIVLTIFLPFKEQKIINFVIILIFALFGYFIVGPKVFKERRDIGKNKDIVD
jgi:hypothetical protein